MKPKALLKKTAAVLGVALLVTSSTMTAFAHSGRTDSSGGHRDNQNKSGLGSYHYHCGGYPAHLHDGGYCPYTDVMPSSVNIRVAKTTLGIGEEVSIDATVSPANASDTYVTWSSSDTSVVSVYDGEIVAKNYGTATITAETVNGKKSSVKITVKEIVAEKVIISGWSDTNDYYIGDSFALAASVSPENVDNPAIGWSSSNDKIATVSEDGNVKLISAGEVEIKATASNGVSAKVTVNVKEKQVEAVKIEDTEIEMLLGETYALNAIVTPDDATNPKVTWSVENPDVVSVSEDGSVKALACGETVITATSNNSIKDSVTVKVSGIKAESIEISGADKVKEGETLALSAVFTPSNTTNQTVTWSTNNPETASIDENGVLTAIKEGTVKVSAVTADGIKAEYEINVTSSGSGSAAAVGAVAVAGAAAAIIIKKKKSR